MDLSTYFEIDARDPEVVRHNREVQDVWAAYRADPPIRIPVQFAGARTLSHERHGLDWRGYYEDPDEMIRLQLATAKSQRELPRGDHPLGVAPEQWDVRVDFHPIAPAASFGCEIVFRPDAVPAHHSILLSLEACRDLPLPDLRTSAPAEARAIQRAV